MSATPIAAPTPPGTARAAAPTLEVRDLVVTYGGVRAVDAVSLRAERGQVLGIVGPNGAGKSSLLAAIGGQMRPSEGQILLEGEDVTGDPPHRRARRGISPASASAAAPSGTAPSIRRARRAAPSR